MLGSHVVSFASTHVSSPQWKAPWGGSQDGSHPVDDPGLQTYPVAQRTTAQISGGKGVK